MNGLTEGIAAGNESTSGIVIKLLALTVRGDVILRKPSPVPANGFLPAFSPLQLRRATGGIVLISGLFTICGFDNV